MKQYVEATQRGYAYGLVRGDGQRIYESYVHTADDQRPLSTRVGEAYRKASASAAQLLYTWRHRPELIKDQSKQLPGKLYRS